MHGLPLISNGRLSTQKMHGKGVRPKRSGVEGLSKNLLGQKIKGAGNDKPQASKTRYPDPIDLFSEGIVETIRAPLLVLDSDLRVLFANQNFLDVFKVDARETLGRRIFDLGNRQWDIPRLHTLLEKIISKNTRFDNYRVEHSFPSIGRRVMILNARRLQKSPKLSSLILLAFEDITERIRTQQALQDSEERFRRAFETAEDGMLLVDKSGGQILNANPAAKKMLGYSKKNLINTRLWEIGFLKDGGDFSKTALQLEKKGVLVFIDTTIKNKNGKEITADVHLMDRAKVIQCNFRDTTKRKILEDKLIEDRQRYQELFNNISSGVAVYKAVENGRDFIFLDFNKAAEKIDEMPRKKVLGRKVSQVFPGIGEMGLLEVFQRVWKTGKPEHHPTSLYQDNHLTGWRENYVYKLPSGEIVAVYEDLTEKKQAEERIKWLASFPEVNPLMVLEVDRKGRVAYANPSTRKQLPDLEKVGEKHPFVMSILEAMAQLDRHTLKTTTVEVKIGERWFSQFVCKVSNYANIRIYAQDVTERKRADEIIAQSEKDLKAAQAVAQVGSWRWDIKTNQLTWSDEMYRIFGISKKKFSGNLADVIARAIHPQDRAAVEAANLSVIRDKKPVPLEYRVIWPDGSIHWVYGEAGELVLDKNGKPSLLTGIVQDITQRKQMQQSLLLMADTQQQLIRTDTLGDFVQVVGKKLLELFAESYIVISMLDEEKQATRVAGLFGFGSIFEKLKRTYKIDPSRHLYLQSDMTPEETSLFRSGKLEEFPGGTYALMTRKFPKMFCMAGEKQLKISKIYTQGLIDKENYLGVIAILARGDITPYKEMIEIIIQQASITLNRIKSRMALEESEERYRDMFEDSPISLWEEDYSTVKQRLDALRGQGIGDLRTYLEAHPEVVAECASLIRVLDVNQATLRLYRAKQKEDVFGAMPNILRNEISGYMIDELIHIAEGQTHFSCEGTDQTLAGEKIEIILHWAVVPGYEGDFSKVLVSIVDITQRKKMEQSLKESEKRFRDIAENSQEWIWEVDSQGKYTFASQMVEKILGYTPGEILQKHFYDLFHPEDREATKSAAFAAFTTKQPFREFINRAVHKNGQTVWLATNGIPLLDDQGNLLGYRGVDTDISERILAQEKLESNFNLLRMAGEHAAFGGWSVDLSNNTCTWSDVVADIHEMPRGYAPQVNEGINFYAPEWREKITKVFTDCAQKGVSYDEEMQIITKNGKRVWVRTIGEAVRDVNGKIVKVQGAFQDITKRKQMENDLRESEERYRLANRAMYDVIWDWDLQTNALWWNENLQTIFGYRAEEVEPDVQSWINRIHPEDRERVDKGMRKALDLGDPSWTDEYRFRCKDGTYAVVEDRGYISRDASGKALRMIGAMRDITQRKQAEEEMRRLINDLRNLSAVEKKQRVFAEALARSVTALRSTLNADEILDSIIANIGQVVPSDAINVMLIEGDTTRVVRSRGYQEKGLGNWIKQKRFELGELKIEQEVIQSKKCKVTPDTEKSKEWVTYPETNWIKSHIIAPILEDDKVIGFVNVDSATPDFYTSEHARQLTSFTDQVAVALKDARLFEATQTRMKRMQAMTQIDQAINSSLDVNISLEIVLMQAKEHLQADAVAILLIDDITHCLVFSRAKGFKTDEIKKANLTLGSGFPGRAVLERTIVSIPDLNTAPESHFKAMLVEREGFVSYYCAPLITKGQLKGVLEIYFRNAFQADREWLEFLEMLAQQTAIAINNADLYESLQISHIELMSAYESTLKGWVDALDMRDHETQGHTQKVTEVSLKLARRMGIKDTDLVNFERGALLHDIGKVAVPDAILKKPGPLTEEEWVIMRRHPLEARELLSKSKHLIPAMDIPYSHHEKWDGSGYPLGLKGTAIPLAARIFAIVDVWDALTSDRPYRKAWSKKKALAYIREQKGKHFDPQIVPVFLSMIQEENK